MKSNGKSKWRPGLILDVVRAARIKIGNGQKKVQLHCPLCRHRGDRMSAVLFVEDNVFYCQECTRENGLTAKRLAEELGVDWASVLKGIAPKPVAREKARAESVVGAGPADAGREHRSRPQRKGLALVRDALPSFVAELRAARKPGPSRGAGDNDSPGGGAEPREQRASTNADSASSGRAAPRAARAERGTADVDARPGGGGGGRDRAAERRSASSSPGARDEISNKYHLTDTGNAERFARRTDGNLRHCGPWKKWVRWDGQRWIVDAEATALATTKRVAYDIRREVRKAKSEKVRARIRAWAKASESAARRRAMLDLAQCEPGIPIDPEQFDRDTSLLNCINGTLDLASGKLRPHRREDFITKLVPTAYDPDAIAPNFERFITRVLPDADLRQFVQRALGYSISGAQGEQVLFVLMGDGCNGKTTLLNAIAQAIGLNYAIQLSSDVLLRRAQRGHPTELADLFGVRLAICSESGQQAELDEVRIKQLTGGDFIRARRMCEDFWQFKPTHHIWVATNHRPTIRGTDYAIWRRILVIPFLVTIKDDERDGHLPEKLRAEAAGILAWAVRGYAMWRTSGLKPPDAVRLEVDAYRADMDVVGQFIEERCRQSRTGRVPATALYRAYQAWCDANGEDALPQRLLGPELLRRGFKRVKSGGIKVYVGLCLSSPEGDRDHQGPFPQAPENDGSGAFSGDADDGPYGPSASRRRPATKASGDGADRRVEGDRTSAANARGGAA